MGRQRQKRLKHDQLVARIRNKKRLDRKTKSYVADMSYALWKGPIPDSQRILIQAPSDFSLTNNRAAVTSMFARATQKTINKTPIIFDMSGIEYTDMPTLCLLMAVMMDKRIEAQDFRRFTKVRYPTGDHPAAKFFDKVEFEKTVMSDKGNADHNQFLSRTSTKDNKGYKKYILDQSKEFFGDDADIAGLNSILTEIITNTHNHADPNRASGEENQLPWFAAWMPIDEENKICYTIVDLGVGIVESWKLRGVEQRRTGILSSTLFDTFFNDSQSSILRKRIPEGVKSSTRLLYRGQGLKEVYEQASNGPYIKFRLFTNMAEVNMLNMQENIQDTQYNLEGTIFYWELQIER